MRAGRGMEKGSGAGGVQTWSRSMRRAFDSSRPNGLMYISRSCVMKLVGLTGRGEQGVKGRWR